MYKRIFFSSLIIFVFVSISGQDMANISDYPDRFFFNSQFDISSLNSINPEKISDHPLGIETAKRLYLIKQTYTVTEPGTLSNPVEKTVILKPLIYSSLLKLNKYYVKEVSEHNLDIEKASRELNYFLNIGLALIHENTESFEQVLRKAKKPEEISEAYLRVVLN
ncbi:MAG: hypothetical protein JXJ22_00265 [Bacteroidales bacterium]|nr:hypothetical protein [Bacteroidales bacterium]